MANQLAGQDASETQLAMCKQSELSHVSGVRRQALRRYDRIGLFSPEVKLESGCHLYTRHDLIHLERLALMQMLGLSRTEIKDCLNGEERDLRDELRLQRDILLEKRRRLNRAIYFMEYAEQVNRDPESGDWHYLGSVVEAIQSVRDPECFKRFYIQGSIPRKSSEERPEPQN